METQQISTSDKRGQWCTNAKVAETGLEPVRELLGEMLISAEGGAKSDAIRAASEHVAAAIDLLSEAQREGDGAISTT